ncbi:MAG: hypothetical protein E7555_06260 [Ruminococcaceae bacterium]|nr:hypothetical protein [Oscillospiraceae bacterium]
MLFTKEKKRDLSPKQGIFSSAFVCYLFPFIVFGGYLLYCILAKLMPHAQDYYLIHYLYTYDHGYISRGLVGEVISWFADTVSDDLTRWVMTGFSVLLMLGMSLCVGKAICNVRFDKERLPIVLFVVVMIFMIPMPYKFYYMDMKLDKLVWALTLFSVYIADTKIGKWIVPFICTLATMVSPVFIFTNMILITIILLQEFYSNGFSAKNGIICGITYMSIIAVAIFAVVSEKWVGFESATEMADYYFARYAGEIDESTRESFNLWLVDYFLPFNEILSTVSNSFFKYWGMGTRTFLNIIFAIIPIYVLLGIFWKKTIKTEKNKFQKFIYFLCAISPVITIPLLVTSWELGRFLLNNILAQAGLVVYFVVKNQPAIVKTCNEVKMFGKKHLMLSIMVVLYLMCYVSAIF